MKHNREMCNLYELHFGGNDLCHNQMKRNIFEDMFTIFSRKSTTICEMSLEKSEEVKNSTILVFLDLADDKYIAVFFQIG